MSTDIKPVFDYNTITDQHHEAADEIVRLLESMGQEMVAAVIKEKFKIIERPKFPFQDTEFVKACTDVGLFCSVQGWIFDGATNVDVPVIAISDDCRKFISLYNRIKTSD